MSYDRDSFLAGLAVGRTLWKPHKDCGEAPEPWGWDVIDHSTQMVSRYEYDHPDTDYYFGKGDSHGAWWGYLADATVPAGYIVNAQNYANSSGMFVNTVVPARFNRLLVDVEAIGISGARNISGIVLTDAYGLSGLYIDQQSFVGTILRRAVFTYWDVSAAWLNNQEGVTLITGSPYSLSRQTVVIDISDLHQDLWVGFQRCDCWVKIYSMRAL